MNLTFKYLKRTMHLREYYMHITRYYGDFLKSKLHITDGYAAINFCINKLDLVEEKSMATDTCPYRHRGNYDHEKNEKCMICWCKLLENKEKFVKRKLPSFLEQPKPKKRRPSFLD
jgi:hypothetical protein